MLDVARQNGFRFDTVQMPINVLDAHYRSFEREVITVALRDGTAVLGMKPMGAGLILMSGAANAEECLRYAMSVPGIGVTITGCDSQGVLEQALAIALDFHPMPDAERESCSLGLRLPRKTASGRNSRRRTSSTGLCKTNVGSTSAQI